MAHHELSPSSSNRQTGPLAECRAWDQRGLYQILIQTSLPLYISKFYTDLRCVRRSHASGSPWSAVRPGTARPAPA